MKYSKSQAILESKYIFAAALIIGIEMNKCILKDILIIQALKYMYLLPSIACDFELFIPKIKYKRLESLQNVFLLYPYVQDKARLVLLMMTGPQLCVLEIVRYYVVGCIHIE